MAPETAGAGNAVLAKPAEETPLIAAEAVRRIEQEEGRFFVHPFNGQRTVLGTATLGDEWSTQAGKLDAVIIPIGGGGLARGDEAVAHHLLDHDPGATDRGFGVGGGVGFEFEDARAGGLLEFFEL